MYTYILYYIYILYIYIYYIYIYIISIWSDYVPSITSTNQNKVHKSLKKPSAHPVKDLLGSFLVVSTHTKYMRIEIIIPN